MLSLAKRFAAVAVLLGVALSAAISGTPFNLVAPGWPGVVGQNAPGWVLSQASVDLDFVNNRSFGGSPTSLLTVSRAQTVSSYATTAAGALTAFAANTLRRTDLGLLIEEARTNLALQSQTLDTTWTAQNATITANSTVAPDGTTTADTFTDNSSNTFHDIFQAVTLGSGTTFCLTAYAKPGTGRYALLNYAVSANNYIAAVFDLVAGTVGETKAGSGSGTVSSASISAVANGFYRLTLIGSVTGANGSPALGMAGAGSGNTFNTFGFPTYAGSSQTIIFWGAQLEAGSFATSYIPTTTVSVTRAADVVTMPGLNYPAPYSLYAEVRPVGQAQSLDVLNTQTSLANAVGLYTPSSFNAWVRESSVTTANAGVGAGLVSNAIAKIAARYAVNDTNVSAAGAAGTADTSNTPPTMTQLNFGPSPVSFSGTYLNGYFRRVALFRTGLSDATLKALTQ